MWRLPSSEPVRPMLVLLVLLVGPSATLVVAQDAVAVPETPAVVGTPAEQPAAPEAVPPQTIAAEVLPSGTPTIPELIAAAEVAEGNRQSAEPAVMEARTQARQLALATNALRLEVSQQQARLKELETAAVPFQTSAKQAQETAQALESLFNTAVLATAAAMGQANAAEVAAAEAVAGQNFLVAAAQRVRANEALSQHMAQMTAVTQRIAELPAAITLAEQAALSHQVVLQQLETEFAKLSELAIRQRRNVERAEVSLGMRVSYAEQVGPIFARRCVACHNARVAKGRFNLETFANLFKGGESGAALVPHQPADSLLLTMIEDQSMPKETDPLTSAEQAIVRKWIELGAPLDTGVDPAGRLAMIIPKPTQPLPPEAYRVPVPVLAVAFSPDGSMLATAGYREVLLWNTVDGQLVRRLQNLAERVHDLEFTPDGLELAVAAGTPGQLGDVKVFAVADGSVARDLLTTDDEVFSVSLSPDGTRLATAGADRAVRVFERATGARQLLVEDHADWVLDVAWSPDGGRFATASRDKTAKIFDAATGQSLATFNGHGQPVYSVVFLPSGQQLASSGRDQRLRIWQLAEPQQVREVGGFGGDVFRLKMQPDGLVYSGCADLQARCHNSASGELVRAFAHEHAGVYEMAVHGPTRRGATCSHHGEVKLWNIDDGTLIRSFIAAPGLSQPVAAGQ